MPARSRIDEYQAVADELGIVLMPWQVTAARYLTAVDADGNWMFREVCIVVARQNGKTTLLIPLIVMRLRDGQRVMHSAQNRALPLAVFEEVAEIMSRDLTLFPRRPNGRQQLPKFGTGSEGVTLTNGGQYRIAAATRGGARGPSNDTVIIDELREMDKDDFIAAVKPTISASRNPQIVYLSNAGEDHSIVLNAVRDRSGKDPGLAYLEWSASPDRSADDPEGWAEANPAIGHEAPTMGSLLTTLEADYRADKLSGTLTIFETEHLCRWVVTMRQRLVDEASWNLCAVPKLGHARRPYFGVSMDPQGHRGSVAMAWLEPDGTVALRMLYDVPGDPIDIAAFGADIRADAAKRRVLRVGFDPLTDAELAKYFPKNQKISGQEFANASAQFVNLVKAGKLRWLDCEMVGDDLTWTARKAHDESGSFQAVRANDDRPITAALAAIRAVWLASEPRVSSLKVY